MEELIEGKVHLHCGDCMEILPTSAPDVFDAVVCDPPYHLASIVKRFGKEGSAPPISDGATGVYKRAAAGFMGKKWDGGTIAFQPETWAEVLRVLKPGGHLAAFAAPKNAHHLTLAIENAGFEIRDVVMWLFGTGFPKSHSVSKALGKFLDYGAEFDVEKERVLDRWWGWGTALKPAYEPIIIARKPLIGTVAVNVMACGVGGINIDACRGEGARWPANVAHDGSAEVIDLFPDSTSGAPADLSGFRKRNSGFGMSGGTGGKGDSGSAARFYYYAKADHDDRIGSKHPTVKPIKLLRWIVRMVTPPNGLILDPFAGTGTVSEAALYEGMRSVAIELEPESQDDFRRRMGMTKMGPEERARAILKARGLVEPFEETELGRAA